MTDYCLNGSKDQCETQIYDALTNFGTDFASYQTAYNTYVSSKTTATTDSYNKSLSKIQTDISNLDMYITEYVSTNSQKGKLPSGKVYQDIVTKYKKILEEREMNNEKGKSWWDGGRNRRAIMNIKLADYIEDIFLVLQGIGGIVSGIVGGIL